MNRSIEGYKCEDQTHCYNNDLRDSEWIYFLFCTFFYFHAEFLKITLVFLTWIFLTGSLTFDHNISVSKLPILRQVWSFQIKYCCYFINHLDKFTFVFNVIFWPLCSLLRCVLCLVRFESSNLMYTLGRPH